MIDLYKLLEKQEYAEVEFADGTELVIRYNAMNNTDMLHTVEWGGFRLDQPIPKYAQSIYHAKTARMAITAAIQARYPE